MNEVVGQVIKRVVCAKEDWKVAKSHSHRVVMYTAPILHVSGNKPPLGSVKYNMDSAFFGNSNVTTTGMCIRND